MSQLLNAVTSPIASIGSLLLLTGGKYVFLSLLKNLKKGHLTIVDGQEKHEYFGTEKPQVTLTVNNQQFYARLLLHADIGLSEAYIHDEFAVSDLTQLLCLFLMNRKEMNQLSVPTALLGNLMGYLKHIQVANTISNTRSNISKHYDLGNELFESFLDETMMYSCAVYADGDDLHTAQLRKIHNIIDKADLKATDHVLEIGTGWGGFAIEAVKRSGCRVTSFTLSSEQKAFAEDKIAKIPEVRDRIQVVLADYRKIPEIYPNEKFDKIVSIEMLEAVGKEFLSVYFDVCHRMLTENGRMVLQCITMPESRYEGYCKSVDFIQKYIFPGGHCPTVSAIVQAVNEGSDGRLIVDDLENIGFYYARTLAEWRKNFFDNYSKLEATGKKVRDSEELFYSQEFKNKWDYYFSYCEAGFLMRSLGNAQLVLAREGSLCTRI